MLIKFVVVLFIFFVFYHLPFQSSSRMRVINHNWSATKQRPHPQSVAEISRHSVLSGDRIRQYIVWVSPQGHRSVSVSHFNGE